MKVITSVALSCVLAAQTVCATLSTATARLPVKTHKEVALFPARKRGLQLAVKKESPQVQPAASDEDHLGDAASPLDQVSAADPEESTAAVSDESDFGGATAGPQEPNNGAEEAEPVLPPISAMTGSAADTIKGINSQASILEARVAQVQMENEAKMARQKAVFEQKLQQQDRNNREVMDQNEKISEEIKELKQGNENMRKRAQELQDENKFKRTELKTLRERLTVAGDFIVKALKTTDDRKAQELAILQAPQQSSEEHHQIFGLRRTVDKDEQKNTDSGDESDQEEQDDDEDTDGEDDAASLLAVAATVRKVAVDSMEESQLGEMADVEAALSGVGGVDGAPPAASKNPRDLINILSTGIESLTKQEVASEAKLKSMFLSRFKAGTKSRTALLAHQKQLNATRASLLSVQSKLRVATSHLDVTRENLEQELHGVGSFLQHLAHLALTPAQEAPGLLKALPDKIIVKGRTDSVPDQAVSSDKGDDK